MVILCFSFWGAAILFSIVSGWFYVTFIIVHKGSNFSTSLLILCYFDSSHCYISLMTSGSEPRWHSGKESACQCRRLKRHRFNPWVGKIPWSRKWQLAPVVLSEKFPGQRSLVGYRVHGVVKNQTQLSARAHTHTHTHTHPEWLVILSIFSCAYQPFVYLLSRTVCLHILPIF